MAKRPDDELDPLTIDETPQPTGEVVEQGRLAAAPNSAPLPERTPDQADPLEPSAPPVYQDVQATPTATPSPRIVAPPNPEVEQAAANQDAFTPQQVEEPRLYHRRASDPLVEQRQQENEQNRAAQMQADAQRAEEQRAKKAIQGLKASGVEIETDPATGEQRPKMGANGKPLYKPAVLDPWHEDDQGVSEIKRDMQGNEVAVPLKPKLDPATGQRYVVSSDGTKRKDLGVDESFLQRKTMTLAGQEASMQRQQVAALTTQEKELRKKRDDIVMSAADLDPKDNSIGTLIKRKQIQQDRERIDAQLADITGQRTQAAQGYETAQAEYLKQKGAMIDSARVKAGLPPLNTPAAQARQAPPSSPPAAVGATIDAVQQDPVGFIERAKEIWNNKEFMPYYGTGVEIKHLVELGLAGKRLLDAEKAGEDGSPEDAKLVAEYLKRSSRPDSGWAKVASIVAQSVAFGGELGIAGLLLPTTAGTGTVVALGETATAKAAAKAAKVGLDVLAERGARKFLTTQIGRILGPEAVTRLGERAVADFAGDEAAKAAVKLSVGEVGAEIAAKTAGKVVQAAVLTPLASPLRITADAIRDTMPTKMSMDDAGKVSVMANDERDGFVQALGNATLSNYIENLSEFSGGIFKYVPAPKAVAALKAAILTKMQLAGKLVPFAAKIGNATNRVAQLARWNSVLGEMGEEYIGGAMHAAVGQGTFKDQLPGVATAMDEGVKAALMKDIIPMAAAFLVPGTAAKMAKATAQWAGKMRAGQQVDDLDPADEAAILKDLADSGATANDMTPEGDATRKQMLADEHASVEGLINDPSTPPEQKTALIQRRDDLAAQLATEGGENTDATTTTISKEGGASNADGGSVPAGQQADATQGQEGKEEGQADAVGQGKQDGPGGKGGTGLLVGKTSFEDVLKDAAGSAVATLATFRGRTRELLADPAFVARPEAEQVAQVQRELKLKSPKHAAALLQEAKTSAQTGAVGASGSSAKPPSPSTAGATLSGTIDENSRKVLEATKGIKIGGESLHDWGRKQLAANPSKTAFGVALQKHIPGFDLSTAKSLAIALTSTPAGTGRTETTGSSGNTGSQAQGGTGASGSSNTSPPGSSTGSTPSGEQTGGAATTAPAGGKSEATPPGEGSTGQGEESATDEGSSEQPSKPRAESHTREAMGPGRVKAVLDAMGVRVMKTDAPLNFRATFTEAHGRVQYELNHNPAHTDSKTGDMTDEQARAYVNASLEEEVQHFAQFEAVRRAWEKGGKRGSFAQAFEAEYAGVRAAMEKDEAEASGEAYGTGWDKLTPGAQGAEFVRQLLQRDDIGTITEATIRSKPIIERILAVLDDLLKRITKAPAALRDAYDRAKAVLAEIEASEKAKSETDSTESDKPPVSSTLDEKRSSTQVNLQGDEAKRVTDFGKTIAADDLYTAEEGYGLEDEPHITALYGLTTQEADSVTKAVEGFGPVKAKIGEATLFENPDKPYDVLKFDIIGPDLHRLNAELRKLPFKSDFPDYHPHMTVAYVKKGDGKKYTGRIPGLTGREVTFDTLKFSNAEREKTDVALTKAVETPKSEEPKAEKPKPKPKPAPVENPAAKPPAKPAKASGASQAFKDRLKDAFDGLESPEPQGSPFFSQLVETVRNIPQATMTVAQARAAIAKGAKPDEIKASGILDDPLSPMAGRPDGARVTRYELTDYAVERQVRVKDVVLGQTIDRAKKAASKDVAEIQAEIDAIASDPLMDDPFLTPSRGGLQWMKNGDWASDIIYPSASAAMVDSVAPTADRVAAREALSNRLDPLFAKRSRITSNAESEDATEYRDPQFAQFQLPGAEPGSYREMFVTWPKAELKFPSFDDWQRENVEKLRLKHVLPVVQQSIYDNERSDAAKEHKRTGWHDGHAAYETVTNPVVRIRRNLRRDQDGRLVYFIEEMQGPGKGEQPKMPEEVRKRIFDIGMKRALRDAVDSGADAIGWTRGETQADRYSLEKQVDGITVDKTSKGNFVVHIKPKGSMDWQLAGERGMSESELASTIGKELAEQAVEKTNGTNPRAEFTGEGLKVGGEGLKRLYDVTLPRIASKLAERVGGRVSTTELEVPDIEGAREDAAMGTGLDGDDMEEIALLAGEEEETDRTRGEKIHVMPIPDAWIDKAPTFALYNAEPQDFAQKPLPKDRRAKLIEIADDMEAEGITTPEKLAVLLDEISGGKARRFSQAMWDMMGSTGAVERGTHDWPAIYQALDQEAKSAPPEQEPEPALDPKVETNLESDGSLAHHVRDRLLAGETLDRRALAAMRGEMPEKEADEAAELGIVMAAREIVRRPGTDVERFDALLDLYNRQPNLTAKTAASKVAQAYSTPVPLAYVASRMAKIDQSHVVEEDTAGNGALLIEADPKKALVNELDPKRAAALRQQGFTVTEQDATKITHKQKADRLSTNPPFGVIRQEGEAMVFDLAGTDRKTTQIDHAIALRSLANLKDDGRAVLIIGGPQAVDQTERRKYYGAEGERGDFFKTLYGQYRVLDHFTVNGDLYRKQGAGWPVDVIMIAGRGPSAILLPTQQPPRILNTWQDLREEITKTDAQRFTAGQYDEQRDRDDLSGSLAGIRAALGGSESSGGSGDNPKLPGQTDAGGSDGGNRRDAGVLPGLDTGAEVLQPPAGETGGLGDGQAAGSGDGRLVDGLKEEAEKPVFHKPYVPVSEGNSFKIETPANLAEPQRAALEAIQTKVGKPLKEYVREKLGYAKSAPLDKYFAAEQLDAIASAIYNIEHNGALILGDMTGVGKGRVVAALIEYAKREHMTPIFVTKNPTLYSAMLGDFHNIGRTVQPFYTNNDLDIIHPVTEESIKTKTQSSLFEEILRTGSLPTRFDAVFTTYDQIGKINDPAQSKESRQQAKASGQAPMPGLAVQAIMRIAAGTGEPTSRQGKALVLLDESHLGAGSSAQGIRVRQLINNAYVYYSSATFAKRPDAMPLYFKTNLRKAANSQSDLMAVFANGGIVMQQIASQMLAHDGQYIRRERTFDGVPFETRINFETEDRDRKLANEYTRGLRTLLDMSNRIKAATKSMNAIMARVGKQLKVPTIKMESADFASQIHNFVKQYLFAIKIEAAAQQAIQAIKQGHITQDGTVKRHKVIIAVENTMEEPIKTLHAAGAPLEFTSLLIKTLEGLRKIQTGGSVARKTATYFTIAREPKPEFRNSSHDDLVADLVRIETKPNPLIPGEMYQVGVVNEPVAEELFRRLANQSFLDAEGELNQLDLGDMPLSPIDYIRQRAAAQGIRSGEITGRTVGIDENGKTYSRDASDIKKKGQLATLSAFNNEDLDLMVINASGSTGVSAHADANFKNKSPRMMIVVQAHLDINEFMQTLGRIFRSGQVEMPNYQLLQTALPAEKRPAAILGQKMAGLNANTTSNADSQVSAGAKTVDIFNEYGDGVVWEYLRANRDFVVALQWPKIVTGADKTLLPLADIMNTLEDDGKLARGVSSYASILSVEEQDAFWEDVLNRYTALLSYLDQIGENKLRASADDLGAETVATEVFTPGTPGGDSAFDAPSHLETVRVKPKTPPMEPREVLAMARTAEEGRSTMIRDYKEKARTFTASYLEQRRQKSVSDWDVVGPRERERLQGQYNEIYAQLQKVGKVVQVQTGTGQQIGAVIAVEIDPDAPVTPSKQIFTVAVNTLKRTIKIPGSKMAESVSEMDPDEFEARYEATREDKAQRQVVTGNLVAASAKLKGGGSVTKFTRADGKIETGILLPVNFSLAAMNSRQVLNAKQAEDLLRDGTEITANDGAVRLFLEDGEIKLSVPSAKSTGGKYWQDQRLTGAMLNGEMVQRGQIMTGIVSDLPAVVSLFRNTFTEPLSYNDQVDSSGGLDSPEPSPVIDSPAFKKWFGASKVVDEKGNPLVVYHGTPHFPFSEFKTKNGLFYFADNQRYAGNFAGMSAKAEPRDSEKVLPFYLSLKKPMYLDGYGNSAITAKEFIEDMESGGVDVSKIRPLVEEEGDGPVWRFVRVAGAEIKAEAERLGYDGIVQIEWHPDSNDPKKAVNAYVAFHPNQIKSADRNDGSFDSSNPSFLRSPDPGDQAPEEKPAEEKPAEEKPAEEKPAEEKPAEPSPTIPILKAAMIKLPPVERKVLVMRVNGQDNAAIIKATGLTERGVENAYRMALGKMKVARDHALRMMDMVAKTSAEEPGKRTMGRPDLANQARGPMSRPVVDALDEIRNESGVPEVKSDEATNERAQKIWDDLGQHGVEEMLYDKVQAHAPLNDEETIVAKRLVAQVATTAIRQKDENAMLRAAMILDAYRDSGTDWGRSGRQRRDDYASPAERFRQFLGEAILTPDAKRKKRLQETRDPAEKEKILKEWIAKMEELKRKMKALGFDLDNLDDDQLTALLRDRVKVREIVSTIATAKADGWDMMYEYWIASILSAPSTNVANLAGNFGNAIWDFTAQRFAEAAVNLAARDPKAAQFGEFRWLAAGIMPGLSRAWSMAKQAWSSESPTFQEEIMGEAGATKFKEQRTHAIPGKAGKIIRTPLRFLLAADEFSKALFGTMQVHAEAYRLAKAEGLKGDAMAQRIRQLATPQHEAIAALMPTITPAPALVESIAKRIAARRGLDAADLIRDKGSMAWIMAKEKTAFEALMRQGWKPDAWNSAIKKAVDLAFQDELGPLGKGVMKIRNDVPGLRYFLPFVQTVANIFKTGIRKSPLGSAALLYRIMRTGFVRMNWSGKEWSYTRTEFVEHAAEQLLAWGALFGLMSLVKPPPDDDFPFITGSVPYQGTKRGARELAYRTAPPQSIRIGKEWYSYSRIEPFATQIAATVDILSRLQEHAEGRDTVALIGSAIEHLTAQMKDKTFARGISDFLNAIQDGPSAIEWAGNFATSWIPNIVRASARETDDLQREQRTWGHGTEWAQQFANRMAYKAMPTEGMAPPAKVDLWGREVEKDKGMSPATDWLWRIFTPVKQQNIANVASIDRLITNWNNQHPNDVFGPEAPAPMWSITRDGKQKTVFMTDHEYNRFLKLAGRASLARLDAEGMNTEHPKETDIDQIAKVIAKSRKEARARVWQERMARTGASGSSTAQPATQAQ